MVPQKLLPARNPTITKREREGEGKAKRQIYGTVDRREINAKSSVAATMNIFLSVSVFPRFSHNRRRH